MNEKHNAYSHISIVESNEARVVLHWRYALADIAGEISNPDPANRLGRLGRRIFLHLSGRRRGALWNNSRNRQPL